VERAHQIARADRETGVPCEFIPSSASMDISGTPMAALLHTAVIQKIGLI
jgi:hypothetical protein